MKNAERILQLFLEKLREKGYVIYSIYPSKKDDKTVYHIQLTNDLKMTLEPDNEPLPIRDTSITFDATFHHLRFNSNAVDLINKVCCDLNDAFFLESTSFSVDERDFVFMETNKDT